MFLGKRSRVRNPIARKTFTSSLSSGPEVRLEEELPEEITAEIFVTDILGLTISPNGLREDAEASKEATDV